MTKHNNLTGAREETSPGKIIRLCVLSPQQTAAGDGVRNQSDAVIISGHFLQSDSYRALLGIFLSDGELFKHHLKIPCLVCTLKRNELT